MTGTYLIGQQGGNKDVLCVQTRYSSHFIRALLLSPVSLSPPFPHISPLHLSRSVNTTFYSHKDVTDWDWFKLKWRNSNVTRRNSNSDFSPYKTSEGGREFECFSIHMSFYKLFPFLENNLTAHCIVFIKLSHPIHCIIRSEKRVFLAVKDWMII